MSDPVSEAPAPDLARVVKDHEVRLVRLETRVESELSGIRSHLREQQADIRQNKALAESIQQNMVAITSKLGELTGSQKAMFWMLGVIGAVIAGLEAWAVFK